MIVEARLLMKALVLAFLFYFSFSNSPTLAEGTNLHQLECSPTIVTGERRFALVIANDKYLHLTPDDYEMPTVKKNMERAGEVFCKLAFKVMQIENGEKGAILSGLSWLNAQLKQSGGVGLIYYSGHGFTLARAERIILTSFSSEKYQLYEDSKSALESDTIDVDTVMQSLNVNGAMGFVIVDACRETVGMNSDQNIIAIKYPVDDQLPLGIPFKEFFAAGVARTTPNIGFDGTFGTTTAFTESLFRNMNVPGRMVWDIAAQVDREMEKLPRPPYKENSKHPSGEYQNGLILTYIFTPPTQDIVREPKGPSIQVAELDSPMQQTAKFNDYFELGNDYRFNLPFWRIRSGSSAPDETGLRLFFEGLAEQKAGQFRHAYNIFKEVAKSGSTQAGAEAQSELGWLLATGRMGQIDIRRAMNEWEIGVQRGSKVSADSLGVALRGSDSDFDWGVPANLERAFELFVDASSQLPTAQGDLGFMHEMRGEKAEAEAYYRSAASRNDPSSLMRLAGIESVKGNFEEGRALLHRAAFELNDPYAVATWARLFAAGVVKDDSQYVFSKLRDAAETGERKALFWYGAYLECKYATDKTESSRNLFIDALNKSAIGRYDFKASGHDASPTGDKLNAIDELVRIHSIESEKLPFSPLVPNMCKLAAESSR